MRESGFFQEKSRLRVVSSLLFFFFVFSGFSVSSSKSEGRSFPLPGDFEEVWNATLEVLKEQEIPLVVQDKKNGYIQSVTFPLYKKEYKEWAKAPTLGSSGFCALEIGLVSKDKTMTVVGIKAYYKRKSGLSTKGFRKRDKSRGVFEGLLAKQINDKLVSSKFPQMKSVILGCDLYYDDTTAYYMIAEAAPHTFAYEQGLRNGDHLYKIDGTVVTPGNLFDFFLNINGETMKKFTLVRDKETFELPVVIFSLDPLAPHFGFQVDRDPKSRQFRVTNVYDGSIAKQAGLLPGDILLEQNGARLDSWKNYYRAILAQRPTEPQVFRIDRSGKLVEKTLAPAAAAEVRA